MARKLIVESGGYLISPKKKTESAGSESKWSASVWKLGKKNLNGRTYTKELAERICKEGKSTVAYDGHMEDMMTGREYGIAKAVCSNPHIEGNEMRVDIDFIDKEYEGKLLTIMSMGVPIGVSSVGYGEEDEDGVIDAESYEVVRYLDFVTMPAGEVYATLGEKRDAKDPEHFTGRALPKAEKSTDVRRRKVAEDLAELMTRS